MWGGQSSGDRVNCGGHGEKGGGANGNTLKCAGGANNKSLSRGVRVAKN